MTEENKLGLPNDPHQNLSLQERMARVWDRDVYQQQLKAEITGGGKFAGQYTEIRTPSDGYAGDNPTS